MKDEPYSRTPFKKRFCALNLLLLVCPSFFMGIAIGSWYEVLNGYDQKANEKQLHVTTYTKWLHNKQEEKSYTQKTKSRCRSNEDKPIYNYDKNFNEDNISLPFIPVYPPSTAEPPSRVLQTPKNPEKDQVFLSQSSQEIDSEVSIISVIIAGVAGAVILCVVLLYMQDIRDRWRRDFFFRQQHSILAGLGKNNAESIMGSGNGTGATSANTNSNVNNSVNWISSSSRSRELELAAVLTSAVNQSEEHPVMLPPMSPEADLEVGLSCLYPDDGSCISPMSSMTTSLMDGGGSLSFGASEEMAAARQDGCGGDTTLNAQVGEGDGVALGLMELTYLHRVSQNTELSGLLNTSDRNDVSSNNHSSTASRLLGMTTSRGDNVVSNGKSVDPLLGSLSLKKEQEGKMKDIAPKKMNGALAYHSASFILSAENKDKANSEDASASSSKSELALRPRRIEPELEPKNTADKNHNIVHSLLQSEEQINKQDQVTNCTHAAHAAPATPAPAATHYNAMEQLKLIDGCFIRDIFFVPMTWSKAKTSILGLDINDAACPASHPRVADIAITSSLLGRVFEGDYILRVNDSEAAGLSEKETVELMNFISRSNIKTSAPQCDRDGKDSLVVPSKIVKLTIMSKKSDGGSESDSKEVCEEHLIDLGLTNSAIEV